MPTTRPRYQVTETEEVAHALDAAAVKWPGEPRSRLLLRLVKAAGEALDEENQGVRERRLKAIEESSGKYSAAFYDGYLEDLREDWPE